MDIVHDLEESDYQAYLKNLEIEIRKDELDDLNGLVNIFRQYHVSISNDFYVGFKINQISKEFDLLRFGENEIVNIELKNNSDAIKMRKQLIQNRHYLKFVSNEIYNFTYVSSTAQLFYLNQEDFVECEFEFLIDVLSKQKLKEIKDVHSIFNPSNYLISPFNSIDQFISGEYFLTDHQENIKKEVLRFFDSETYEILNISGSAGTGKTLLTYDIAKVCKENKRVLIINCANLNYGHNKLNEKYGWEIKPIKYLRKIDYVEYEIVIVDESQRMTENQLYFLISTVKDLNIKCIFSFDAIQRISRRELNNRTPDIIQNESTNRGFKLKNRIRTNKEIASFILKMFDLNKEHQVDRYENIELHYFNDYRNVKSYLDALAKDGWEVINYTGSIFNPVAFDIYQASQNYTVHDIIGQEFDNVVAVIDHHFFYRNNKLEAWAIRDGADYHMGQMLLQILTRSRQKIKLVILGNSMVFNECLKILNKEEQP